MTVQRLMIGVTRPIFVIVDSHSIYRAKLVKDFVKCLNGQLTLYFLPPYSPGLISTRWFEDAASEIATRLSSLPAVYI